jgi:hypothetical protein
MLLIAGVGLLLLNAAAELPGGTPTTPKGLGDPGAIESIRFETNESDSGVTLRGRDARAQLLVTAHCASGQQRDVTHRVEYKSEPEGILSVDATGFLRPLKDGSAKIIATESSGVTTDLPVVVEGVTQQIPINFKNQIVPIFTKLGCNSGGCHGKASGQNGFRLSLLGFYPKDDYEFLVKEDRGRRLFPASPAASLLLTKPLGRSPHGGGKRVEDDSFEYRMIYRWIEQGMPYGEPEDPVVTGIECIPASRVMDLSAQQQIRVVASYSDGTTEDVTRMALYEANDMEMAEASKLGLVSTLDLSGEVAVMARYQGQVSTFRATIPLGAEVTDLPEGGNLIDDAVFAKLKMLGIPPSPVADDSTFFRRVHIDVAGRLPSEEEVRQFLADDDPAKRAKLIDRLVDSAEYADHFTNKWSMVLRNKRRNGDDVAGTYAFHRWIWANLYDNKPYNQMVSEILTAAGDKNINPPVVWYREVDEVNEQVEDTTQLFLGLRIQCARCHHHPFEKWSQNDYYGLAAFFSRVGRKSPPSSILQTNKRERRVFHRDGVATAKNPRSGKSLKPTGLGGDEFQIPADRDPRVYLAEWISDPNNPFFARALVNRYWKHFFSRGIVEPEDDMRATNPASNPELLDQLSKHFIESGFDLKELVRVICGSHTYQLSALPNDYNLKDKQNFSRFYPRRLTAEVLYDSFHQVTATTQAYKGFPANTRAVQLPDPSVGPYFLKVFGQPQADTACECERSMDANLAQSLHLLNSSEVQNKISSGSGRAAQLANRKDVSHEERIRELYRWVFARNPKADELQIALAHIAKHEEKPKVAYEDIIWALVNTKEFLFNH